MDGSTQALPGCQQPPHGRPRRLAAVLPHPRRLSAANRFRAGVPHDHSADFTNRVLATPKGPRPYLDLLFWISFVTLTGLPATTAPVGLTRDGLPVGIQIIGPYLEDATPIDLAGKLADVIGGFRPPKGY